ncbi:CHAP domain-containing protein [Sphingobium sp. AN558]|uniref:CHAP domain-containing protein n=1 Tax=Sphingobium sp. AN558 TaxID=3133442 RepID=UPI0030BD406C
MSRFFRWPAALLLACLTAAPALGATALQCVPYARIVSGVDIYGDALNWWDQAQDRFKRGHKPKKGAVLAFRPVGPMTLGHVAVVSKVLDDRRVLIRHANWSAPGAIEEDVLALDVSPDGDWSQVRVWHSPTAQMGARTNPTFGFIYPARAKLHKFDADPALGTSVRFASVDPDQWRDSKEEGDSSYRSSTQQTNAIWASSRSAGPREPMPVRTSTRRSPPRPAPTPTVASDPFIVEYAENTPAKRSLGDIIADVKRDRLLR